MAPEQDNYPAISRHEENIAEICRHLQQADTRGELGERIARLVLRHSPADIQ
jgi:hypothetical protein